MIIGTLFNSLRPCSLPCKSEINNKVCRVELHNGSSCLALPEAVRHPSGDYCHLLLIVISQPSREIEGGGAVTLHLELPQGPFLSLLTGDRGKGGLVLEKGQRPFNEFRKAHLLTITARDCAITSCQERQRQDMCWGGSVWQPHARPPCGPQP